MSTHKKLDLTKLESDFIKFQWVLNRLWVIYKKFPEIDGTDKISGLFRAIQRETIILQLHNFVIIRNSFIEQYDAKKVDECLEPLWKPIIEIRKGIELYRHNYIAHIQESAKPFKMMPDHIIGTHKMPTFFAEWLFRAGCVMFYCQQLNANFKKEWDSAEKKYNEYAPSAVISGNLRLDSFKKELGIRLGNTIDNLKKSSLGYLDPREKK